MIASHAQGTASAHTAIVSLESVAALPVGRATPARPGYATNFPPPPPAPSEQPVACATALELATPAVQGARARMASTRHVRPVPPTVRLGSRYARQQTNPQRHHAAMHRPARAAWNTTKPIAATARARRSPR